jgi:hypothetical protein
MVDFSRANVRESEHLFKAGLLFGETHFRETKDGTDLVAVAGALEDGDDGAISVASDINSHKKAATGVALMFGDFVATIEGVIEAEGRVGMEEIVEAISGAVADVHENAAVHLRFVRRGSDPLARGFRNVDR